MKIRKTKELSAEEKRKRMILFFGFYLIFFTLLGLYINSFNNKVNDNELNSQMKENSLLTINKLINLDNYQYKIEIIDEDNTIMYHGTKEKIDYANYENKYFLDIYNINQLIKKSKLMSTNNNISTYVLDNEVISEFNNNESSDGVNKIIINSQNHLLQINLDLHEYMQKEKYEIKIIYEDSNHE